MKLNEYMHEMNLIMKQNPIENDMYYIIQRLMREGNNLKKLSLRDVDRRQNTERGRVFYGIASVPDFVILDEEFENSEDWHKNVKLVYGCVEIKKFDEEISGIKEILEKIRNRNTLERNEAQLLGEILWYRKVLYTNGNEWKFFRWEVKEVDWEKVKSFAEKEYKNDTENKRISEWYLKPELDLEKALITEINITEKPITEMDNEEWNVFLERLYSIQWYNSKGK